MSTHMSLRSLLVACAFASSLSCLPATADDFADVSKFIRAGQFNEAMAKVDAVLTQRPRDAQMRFLKGLILTEQNKNAEAITVFTKLTEDYPELPEPHNNLAVLYASSGQYDKARAALEAAIRTNPTYATAHENLGDVYAKLASQAYDKALQLDSGNNSAKSKLTMVRTLVGNTTSAALPKPGTTVASATPSKATTKPATPTPTPAAVATPVAVAPSPTPAAFPPPIASAAASKASTLIAKAETKPEAKPEKPETKPEVKVEAKPDPKAEAKQKALEAKAAEKAAQEAKAAEKAERLAEAKAQEAKANVERDDVLKAVNSWAKAWSSKDMKGYLNAYGNDFQTPKGEPRKAWADERRQRIESKGRISVQVEEAQVKLEGNTATVKFRQIYTSDKLTANSRKILVLTKQGSKWQIKQERSAS
ncbi:MAG: tetratricopeptide repeat protein [Burkholderiales bacterium]|nr:tetratricopeptide repeat protein [Burkholderiales bacterium]